MFVPCILAGTHVKTWFKLMRTLYGCLTKPKLLTVRQRWMASNFKFLTSHLTIHMPHSQLGRVPITVMVSVA